jgi:hypothetical protein
VLLACNADGSDKLAPLVNGKYRSPHCFKNINRLPTKYEANTNSWMNTNIFDDYLTQLDRKLGANNCKILLFIVHCAAHLKNTTFLSNIKVIFLPANCISQLQPLELGITRAVKCHYKKAVDLEDCSYDRWGTAPRCFTDAVGCVVCNVLHTRSLEIDNTLQSRIIL